MRKTGRHRRYGVADDDESHRPLLGAAEWLGCRRQGILEARSLNCVSSRA
jgi:hypothetical protein